MRKPGCFLVIYLHGLNLFKFNRDKKDVPNVLITWYWDSRDSWNKISLILCVLTPLQTFRFPIRSPHNCKLQLFFNSFQYCGSTYTAKRRTCTSKSKQLRDTLITIALSCEMVIRSKCIVILFSMRHKRPPDHLPKFAYLCAGVKNNLCLCRIFLQSKDFKAAPWDETFSILSILKI